MHTSDSGITLALVRTEAIPQMTTRLLLLATLITTAGVAAPLKVVFTGNATGTIGTTAFANQPFNMTFSSDTASVTHGTVCCAEDYTTPPGTAATFSVGSTLSGTLTDDQAVFAHGSEQTLGIWHYNDPDWLTIGNPAFSTYTLAASIGPISGTTFTFPTARVMKSSAGDVIFASVSGVSVTVTVSSPTTLQPVISSMGTAYSTGMAQNTWIAIVGDNLVPAGVPASGFDWSASPSFSTGKLPTSLYGVTVTVNGKPGYVYFFCSGATPSSICPKDQINVLTPLDSTTGPIQVTVSNGTLSSAAVTATESTVSPAMLLFKSNYVTATHSDFRLLGPTTLYPGFSTPASVGETVVLWTIGFGLPTTTLTQGSSTQTGSLATMPTCLINNAAATVTFAGLVQAGLYQLNVVIPNGAVNGDNSISCTYGGASTQNGLKIAVAR